MTREEFMKWFDANTCYEKDSCFGDWSWKEEVDYSSGRCDFIWVNEKNVEYTWEELYWGGSDLRKREFTFEEFIEAYKNDSIR